MVGYYHIMMKGLHMCVCVAIEKNKNITCILSLEYASEYYLYYALVAFGGLVDYYHGEGMCSHWEKNISRVYPPQNIQVYITFLCLYT